MTCLKLIPSEPGAVLALLMLPEPLTPQALHELEHAVAETLAMRRRDTFGTGAGVTPGQDPSRPYAAEAEYASWMPDPCAIEVASWAAHLQSAVRRMPAGTTSCANLALH